MRSLTTILIFISTGISAQVDSLRYRFVHQLSQQIANNYILPDVGKRMSDSILLMFSTGKYNSLKSMDEFAFELTVDLRRISHDAHIDVIPMHNSVAAALSDTRTNGFSIKQANRYWRKQARKAKRFEKRYKMVAKGDMFTYGDQ